VYCVPDFIFRIVWSSALFAAIGIPSRIARDGLNYFFPGHSRSNWNREEAIQRFTEHNADVIASIAPKNLLVYDLKQGWGPLCAFLEVPVPSEPMPNLNDASTMLREIERHRRIWLAGIIGGFVAMAAIATMWMLCH
jgi:hypothetical protein